MRLQCPNCLYSDGETRLFRFHVDNCEKVFCTNCRIDHIFDQHCDFSELTEQESQEFKYLEEKTLMKDFSLLENTVDNREILNVGKLTFNNIKKINSKNDFVEKKK